MRVAFIGSRSWTDQTTILNRLSLLDRKEDTVVLSDAEGAEAITRQLAKELDLKVDVIQGSWERDKHEALIASCDKLEAFVRNQSWGTYETVKLAGRLGRPAYVWTQS